MAIDFKTISADTTFGSGAFLFGADSQSASEPSLYSESTVFGYLLGLANTWTNSQTINTGEKTASAPILDMSQTWNNGAVTFTGIKANITDTSSASGSLLLDLQVGGSSKLRVDKTGALVNTLNTFGTSNFTLRGGSSQNTGINIQGSSIYFQSSTAVGAVISISGSAGNISSSSTGLFGFHLSTPGFDAVDTMLTRRGAANLRLGAADAASPIAQTLSVQSVVAGTTNGAGQNFTITGSQGTGTGAGGSIIFQVAPAGSSGTAQNALVDALTIDTTHVIFSRGGGSQVRANGEGFTAMSGANSRISMSQYGLRLTSDLALSWSGSPTNPLSPIDTYLYRDAANTLALRNGTAAQRFNLYKTFTDASNYARLVIDAGSQDSNTFAIWGQSAGTGSYLAVDFGFSNTKLLRFYNDNATLFGLNLLFFADNTYDIGASGATRPRTIYAGTTLYAGNNFFRQDGYLFFNGSAFIQGVSAGVLKISNNSDNGFGRLQFGGTTSSFPALKRSSDSLHVVKADDSGLTDIVAKNILNPFLLLGV